MAFREEMWSNPSLRFLLLVSLCAISALLFSLIGVSLAHLLYGFDVEQLTGTFHEVDKSMVGGLKLMQLFSAIGVFIVPPFIYAIVITQQPLNYLRLIGRLKPINYALVFLFMLVFTPFLAWLVDINAQLVLPNFLSGVEEWMKSSEEKGIMLTKMFLTFDGVPSLIYTLLIVAVIPAVGEELIFRGILQKISIEWTKNMHLGIWITAILFSALHLQFYGFLPRLILGVGFGYLFYWSQSLWIPILGHFINNGSVVILSYLYPETIDETYVTFLSNPMHEVFLTIGSVVMSLSILILFKRFNANVFSDDFG